MIDGSVLQSAQRCFEKKSRVVVKMVVRLLKTYSLVIAFHGIWWLLEEPLVLAVNSASLLAASVLGHSFGSFTDGVFGQFTGQKQPDGGLDLAGADG